MPQPVYCFIGGKSAGHILPALNLAQMYRGQDAYLIYISNATPLDYQLVGASSCIDEHIAYQTESTFQIHILRAVGNMLRCFFAFIRSVRMLQRTFPDRVVATGGMLSVPVCCAAWLLHIPVEVYEYNAVPGMAVYYLSYIAEHVNICFSQAQERLPSQASVRGTEYPHSPDLRKPIAYEDARHMLNIPEDTCVILVVGGSQGSACINHIAMQATALLSRGSYMIFHQTGYHDPGELEQVYQSHAITAHVFAFRSDMHLLYRAADGCIARAGAGTLFELHYCAVPAFIIPLPSYVTTHQYDNAIAMQQSYPEQFQVALQEDLTASDVAEFMAQRYDAMAARTQIQHVGDGDQPSHPLSR